MATKTIALDTSLKSHTKIHILFSCGAQCCTHLNHKALDFRWNRTDKVRVGLTEMAVRERVTTSLNHPRANWGIMHLRAPLLRSMEDFPFVTMKKLILWITLLNLTQFHRKLDFLLIFQILLHKSHHGARGPFSLINTNHAIVHKSSLKNKQIN